MNSIILFRAVICIFITSLVFSSCCDEEKAKIEELQESIVEARNEADAEINLLKEKLQESQSNHGPDCPIEDPIPLLNSEYLKCYVIHPSFGNNYKRAVVGVGIDISTQVPAFSVELDQSIKVDSIIYLRLEKISNKLNVEVFEGEGEPDNVYGNGDLIVASLFEMRDYLFEMESHAGENHKRDWHKKGHIILKRKEGLLNVYNLKINEEWRDTDVYSYSDMGLTIGSEKDTLFILDTIDEKIYLRALEANHYPHPPKNY